VQLTRFLCVLGCAAALGAAAPSALAAPLDQHRGGDGHGGGWQQGGGGRQGGEWRRDNGWRDGGRWQGGGWSRNRGFFPGPVVIAPPAVVPVPVPVPVPIQSAILPPLQQVFPAAGFAQNPPQLLPLQGSNAYAVSSPALFCGVDQSGTCQLMAQQLAQITPGWGTAVMDGPQGYGIYLTYQPA
jgi:hypothetical protein